MAPMLGLPVASFTVPLCISGIAPGDDGRPLVWPAIFVPRLASIVNRSSNMFTLIALGVGVAYAIASPRRSCRKLSAALRGMNGHPDVYLKPRRYRHSCFLLGQVLELRPRAKRRAPSVLC